MKELDKDQLHAIRGGGDPDPVPATGAIAGKVTGD